MEDALIANAFRKAKVSKSSPSYQVMERLKFQSQYQSQTMKVLTLWSSSTPPSPSSLCTVMAEDLSHTIRLSPLLFV